MRTLSVDIETYSSQDLGKVGVYKYVDSPDFRILLFAYQYDDSEEVNVIDLTEQELPKWLADDLLDPGVRKTAFNAQFERVALNKHLGAKTANWECTMIKSWMMGFSGGLAAVSKALGVKAEDGKKREGQALIRMFCMPRKPTKANPGTEVFTPKDRPAEWQSFIEYNRQDVVVEKWIRDKLDWYDLPKEEWELYAIDQEINDRGVRMDVAMAQNAVKIDETQTDHFTARFQEITGIATPNQLQMFKEWLGNRGRGSVAAITKDTRDALTKQFEGDDEAIAALECRFRTGKSSIAKYQKIVDATCSDGRMRGTLQFAGAQRTSRWAGRLVQVQNLPRNHIEDIEVARDIIRHGDFELLSLLYDDPEDIMSQCIRPTIIPSEGKRFAVCDYSAIEARVVAWLAGEEETLDVFRGHGLIYEATAAKMFKVPIEEIHKGSMERQKGKVAVLACGYQGGVGAFKAFGGERLGLSEAEMQDVVDIWRESNPNIVKFWYDAENAVKNTISTRKRNVIRDGIEAYWQRGILWLTLPSGRALAYPRARVVQHDKWEGATQIVYGEVESTGKWRYQETYGGRLVENITQAVARDCLARALKRLHDEGYYTVMHVHDEIIVEVDKNDDALPRIQAVMGEDIPWAKGLPLTADGFYCDFYTKD